MVGSFNKMARLGNPNFTTSTPRRQIFIAKWDARQASFAWVQVLDSPILYLIDKLVVQGKSVSDL